MKNSWWEEKTRLLQAAVGAHSTKTFFNELKPRNRPQSRGTSSLLETRDSATTVWPAEHFIRLLNCQFTNLEYAIDELQWNPALLPPHYYGHLIITATTLLRPPRYYGPLVTTATSLLRPPRYYGHLVITATWLLRQLFFWPAKRPYIFS